MKLEVMELIIHRLKKCIHVWRLWDFFKTKQKIF